MKYGKKNGFATKSFLQAQIAQLEKSCQVKQQTGTAEILSCKDGVIQEQQLLCQDKLFRY